jgi:hypothetical protein
MVNKKDPEHRLTIAPVIVATERQWATIQKFLAEHSLIVYVRKIPYPHKLKVSEEFSEVNNNVSEESNSAS